MVMAELIGGLQQRQGKHRGDGEHRLRFGSDLGQLTGLRSQPIAVLKHCAMGQMQLDYGILFAPGMQVRSGALFGSECQNVVRG